MIRLTHLLLFSGMMFAAGICAGKILQNHHSRGISADSHDAAIRRPVDQPAAAAVDSAPDQPPTSPFLRHIPCMPGNELAELATTTQADFGPVDSVVLESVVSEREGLNAEPDDTQADELQTVFLASLSQLVSQPHVETSSDVTEGRSRKPADPELLALIAELLPNASEDQVTTWAEELYDWDLESVRFLFQQRAVAMNATHARQGTEQRLVTSTASIDELLGTETPHPLPSLIPQKSVTAVPDADDALSPAAAAIAGGLSIGIQPRDSPTESALSIAQHVLNRNLRGVHVPGYRAAAVILPSADASSAIDDLIVTTNFNPGSDITTGSPLHVLLPADPALMFMLEDGSSFTRRGDFSVLSDGTLGLRLGRTERSLHNSPQMSANGGSPEILPDGRIVERIPASQTSDGDEASEEIRIFHELGRLPLCRITRLDLLKSDDGLIFHLPAETSRLEIADADVPVVELSVGRLELSNVVIADQRVMLQNLELFQQSPSSRPQASREFFEGRRIETRH